MSSLKHFIRGDLNLDYGWQVLVMIHILMWTGTVFVVSLGAWVTWKVWTS